jgi:2-phospho-L-lactate guanylyltransferase
MPMKPFAQAKSRLAAAMSPVQRERMVHALFLRTQRFFAIQFPDFDRLVVTPSVQVREACWRIGARCLLEPRLDGLNVAANRGLDWACKQGYERVLIVPGDVPVWMRGEVNTVLELGGRHDVVIAKARDGGTNALLLRLPADSFDFRYGPDSAAAHLRAALAAGLSAATCQPPFLAHDLDVPADCLLDRARPYIVGEHR